MKKQRTRTVHPSQIGFNPMSMGVGYPSMTDQAGNPINDPEGYGEEVHGG